MVAKIETGVMGSAPKRVRSNRHCLVSAQASCREKYPDFSLIAGTPAKAVMDLRKAPIINKGTKRRQYPWPYNFERNMPWQGIGFDEWLKQNNRQL